MDVVKFVRMNVIYMWAGVLPNILGGWTLSDWQTWLCILSIVFCTNVRDAAK